jgi:hypothetical protein
MFIPSKVQTNPSQQVQNNSNRHFDSMRNYYPGMLKFEGRYLKYQDSTLNHLTRQIIVF